MTASRFVKPYGVLGYTADADTYCPNCTNKRYGPFPRASFDGATYDTEGFRDREGNEVYPIFASSEWGCDVYCSDCGEFIIEGEHDDDC